ncbi:hypothetical protein VTI74DRAFT_8994 [Chaetomium olivicolor]
MGLPTLISMDGPAAQSPGKGDIYTQLTKPPKVWVPMEADDAVSISAAHEFLENHKEFLTPDIIKMMNLFAFYPVEIALMQIELPKPYKLNLRNEVTSRPGREVRVDVVLEAVAPGKVATLAIMEMKRFGVIRNQMEHITDARIATVEEAERIKPRSRPTREDFERDTSLCATGLQFKSRGTFTASFRSESIVSNSAVCRWWPPPEPDKPPVPYKKGFQFQARRVKPPPPFLGEHREVPTKFFADFLKQARFLGRDFLQTTTLVDYCVSAASKPLPCEDLEETAAFKVVTCKRRGHKEALVAKIYDPLYYPFADPDVSYMPDDVIASAEGDFTLESAAYAQLDKRLGGSLIPKFHGSWFLELPLKQINRPVGFILVEYLKGVHLNTLNPKLYTQQERLRVLALCMEAEIELRFAGVIHNDLAPRNIICSGRDFLARDFQVKIIDFNFVEILPLLEGKAPYESEPLPESPVELFWNYPSREMEDWLPEGWGKSEWNRWLREMWGTSTRFMPVPEDLLHQGEEE